MLGSPLPLVCATTVIQGLLALVVRLEEGQAQPLPAQLQVLLGGVSYYLAFQQAGYTRDWVIPVSSLNSKFIRVYKPKKVWF